MTSIRSNFRILALAAAIPLVGMAPRSLVAQSLEGSKWSIDQEGVETPVVWWLGSQGRVRTGDIGTILPGYRWVQKEDSLIVSVGDTVRYAGVLMATRLVGVRTGPRRQEGWWSGARADAPTTVAQTPVTTPATEPMNRPVEQAVTTPPTTQPTTTTTPPPRTLRRIEREGAPSSTRPAPASAQPSSGEGREIRRLPRPGRAAAAEPVAAAPSGPLVDAAPLIGRWVSHNPNLNLALEIRPDSTATFTGRNGTPRQLRWTAAGDGIVMTMDYTGEGDREVAVRQDGAGLRMQGRGTQLYILMDRAAGGSSVEPAVRQP